MNFTIKEDGSLSQVGIESSDGVELFKSTKYYRSVDDAMKDIVGVVEMCRKKEIIIKDKSNGEEE